MNTFYSFLRSEIVLIPFVVALFRWRNTERSYYPFFTLLGLGVVSELVSFWIIHWKHTSNASATNVYGLLECSLIIYQFFCWNSFQGKKRWFYALQAGSLFFWLLCNLVFYHLNDFDLPFYRILYPFLLVILSVNEINLMITHDNRNLYKNSRFVICLGFITFFLYQVLYEGAYFVSNTDKTAEGVTNEIISLFSYVNVLVYGLYLIAVLLVPRKRHSAFERIFDQIGDDL
jgi:hypothetical protein